MFSFHDGSVLFSLCHRRAGDKASSILAPVLVLLALVAGLWLGFQLSRVDDMCSVGRESLHIGAFMIGSASENISENLSREYECSTG